jgi:hypothetical protein
VVEPASVRRYFEWAMFDPKLPVIVQSYEDTAGSLWDDPNRGLRRMHNPTQVDNVKGCKGMARAGIA